MAAEETTPQITADGLVVLRADATLAARAGVHDPHAPRFVTEGGRRLAAMAQAVDPCYAAYNLARFRRFGRSLAEAGAAMGQILLLGSGYDTRAWWMPELAATARIVEIDMPGTLAAKRAMLAAHGVAPPPNLTAIAADLDTADLPALLRDTGWDTARPAFVLAEGVFYYLQATTVDRLLRPETLALAPGSALAFDWWDDARTARLNAAVAARGGPRLFHPFPLPQAPDALAAALRARGFDTIRDEPLDRVARAVWVPPHDWTPDPGWRLVEATVGT